MPFVKATHKGFSLSFEVPVSLESVYVVLWGSMTDIKYVARLLSSPLALILRSWTAVLSIFSPPISLFASNQEVAIRVVLVEELWHHVRFMTTLCVLCPNVKFRKVLAGELVFSSDHDVRI